ncbi:MAG: zinc finger domain-containing protein, partial [Myxococcales bacterium]
GRARKPCLVCGEEIRVRRASRITYFCPSCQRSGAATTVPGSPR